MCLEIITICSAPIILKLQAAEWRGQEVGSVLQDASMGVGQFRESTAPRSVVQDLVSVFQDLSMCAFGISLTRILICPQPPACPILFHHAGSAIAATFSGKQD